MPHTYHLHICHYTGKQTNVFLNIFSNHFTHDCWAVGVEPLSCEWIIFKGRYCLSSRTHFIIFTMAQLCVPLIMATMLSRRKAPRAKTPKQTQP